jgi:hypothetical protein
VSVENIGRAVNLTAAQEIRLRPLRNLLKAIVATAESLRFGNDAEYFRTLDVKIESLPCLDRERVFIKGATHIFAGLPKEGKSTFLTWLIAEWAAAGEQVLYLSEEPEIAWKDRLDNLDIEALGDNLRIWCATGKPENELLRAAADGPSTIVVIDTLSLMGLDDIGRTGHVMPVLRRWVPAMRASGKTLIIVSHLTKTRVSRSTRLTDQIGGAVRLQGEVDQLIAFRRLTEDDKNTERQVTVRGRFHGSEQCFVVKLTGFSPAITYEATDFSIAQLSDAEAAVYEVLDDKVPSDYEAIEKATGLKEAVVRRACKSLWARKLAEEVSGLTTFGRGQKALWVLRDTQSLDGGSE